MSTPHDTGAETKEVKAVSKEKLREVVAAVQKPVELEQMDSTQLEQLLAGAGGKKMTSREDPHVVTPGWGEQLGLAKETGAMVLTKDGKLVELNVGSTGNYALKVHIEDTNDPSFIEWVNAMGMRRAKVLDLLAVSGYGIGPKLQLWLEEQEAERQHGVRAALLKLRRSIDGVEEEVRA